MKKSLPVIFFLTILLIGNNLYAINGKITDKLGNPVSLAKIVFTNTKDSTKIYQTFSDANGNYSL